MPSRLNGKRVLIVDDLALFSIDLTEALRAVGAAVVSVPPTQLDVQALPIRPDMVVFNIDLADARSQQQADALLQQGLATVLVTANNLHRLPARYAGIPCWGKPIDTDSFVQQLAQLSAAPGAPPPV